MATKRPSEPEHDFVLVLTGIAELTAAVEDALFEAGCDDATISFRYGRVFLRFSRTAASLKEAILSAIQDVREADIGADVLRVDGSDLVTQAEIARKIGRSRQLVHQYITGVRGPGGFPAPVSEPTEGAPLWSWCEVAHWLWRNDMVKEDAMREAQVVGVINHALGLRHQRAVDPALIDMVLQVLGSQLRPAEPGRVAKVRGKKPERKPSEIRSEG